MAVVIRRATLTELPALVALERSFPGDRLSRRSFRHLLTRARAEVWVAVADDRVAANAVVLYRTRTRQARLYSLVVDPALRGRGIAQALLEAAEAAARARGCVRVYLEVRRDNGAALALYAKRGYRPVGRISQFYEDGEDALRLERRLEPAAPARAPHDLAA